MIERRFENRLNKSNVKFNTLNPVWDNEKEDGLNVFEMIDELNYLNNCCDNLIDDNTEYVAEINQMHKENEQLKKQREELFILERDTKNEWRTLKKENEQLKQNCKNYNWYKQYKTLLNENEKLKKENLDLSEELDYYKAKCASLETGLFQVDRENEQLRKENKKLKSINNQLEDRLEESGIGIALKMEDLND